jgi:hypothetical protein
MEKKQNLQFVEPLRKLLKQLNKNDQCIYPGCTNKPIGSHIIPESILKLLVDSHKVLTLERTDDDHIVNAIQGHSWDHVYRQSKRIGTGTQATYPIFCAQHDNDVFAPLEKSGYRYEPQRAALLAYRALCHKTWNPNEEQKLELYLTRKDEKTRQLSRRLIPYKIFLEARQKVSNMLQNGDYHQMRWMKQVVHARPYLACTEAFIPYLGDQELHQIATSHTMLIPEDIVTFTFLPDKNLSVSECVITWFKNNGRGEQFIKDLDLSNPSESTVRHNLISEALTKALLYISPEGWNALTPEQQETFHNQRMHRRTFIFGEIGASEKE